MSSSRTPKRRRMYGSPGEYRSNGVLGQAQVNETPPSQDLLDQSETCRVWTNELKRERNWGYNGSGGLLHDYAFYPGNLLKAGFSMALIRKHGKEGVHYALGYPGLQKMIDRYGLEYAPRPNTKMVQVQASTRNDADPANSNNHHQAPAAATGSSNAGSAVVDVEYPDLLHQAAVVAPPAVTPVIGPNHTVVERLSKLERELGIKPKEGDIIPTRLEQVEREISVTSEEANDTIKIRIDRLERELG